MKKEGEVKKETYHLLSRLENCGDIIWFERLNAGSFMHEGNHIKLSREGTPDFVCVFQNVSRGLSCIFIEVKSEGVKEVPRAGAQVEWCERYAGRHRDVYYMVSNSVEKVHLWIHGHALDRVLDMQFDGR